ncbi:hypothetical protein CERSUDRAFT_69600 [Gelatoporia subvermispora B]|uniref:Isochorismatase-like domain-containing protein n=1 Tax=Ceriporiopsis subvermispora (strain B) TaxID=914234 RepID=M2QX39_CERS8|nr:hypothetical protein CERSUDRAFT_69600 [Gelatoporia subvermispora B]
MNYIIYRSPLFIMPNFKYERIDKDNVLLLVVDHQEGLYQLLRDQNAVAMKNNVSAHAALAKVFQVLTILTTSADNGPNGPSAEIIAMHPAAPFIKRNGEVNAWDNPVFRAAVCTAFLTLSLRDAGYSVFANSDASGTFDAKTAQETNDRMQDAGVQVLSMFAVACELMRDWRNTPGAKELLPFFDVYLSEYGFLARAHGAAVQTGTLSKL